MSQKGAQEVARAWGAGEAAHRANVWTDGQSLWSYGLLIGLTDEAGRKVLLDYRGRYSVSTTTSGHVGAAERFADRVETPEKWLPKKFFKIPRISRGSTARTQDVVRAWVEGRRAKVGELVTDGVTLWSFDTVIGQTRGEAKVAVEPDRRRRGPTQREHLRLAKLAADRTISGLLVHIPMPTLPAAADPTKPRVGPRSTALEIIRAEYGYSTNMMTPKRIGAYKFPGGAVELSVGVGIPRRSGEPGPPIYALSVVYVNEDGTTRRAVREEAGGVFFDLDAAYDAIEGLGGRVRRRR
jgi:hypothetical protein